MRTRLQPGETVASSSGHWIVLAKPVLFFFASFSPFLRHVRLAGFEAMVSYLFPYLLALSAGCSSTATSIGGSYLAVTTSRLIDEFRNRDPPLKGKPPRQDQHIVVEQTIAGRIFNYGSISVRPPRRQAKPSSSSSKN